MHAITVEQALQMAISQMRAGRLAEAEATFRKILAAQPDHEAARRHLGEIRARLEGTASSVPEREEATVRQSPPRSASDWVDLGNALMDQGQLADAVAAFEQALRIEPGRPEIHYNLGNACARQEEWQKAITCYHRALALRPDYRKAQVNLGCVLLNLHQPAAALEHLQHHLEGPTRHYYLGVALAAAARWDEALAAYRATIALDAEYAEAHWALASTLLLLGRFEEGWQALEKRERCRARLAARPQIHAPRWNGARVEGATILLYEEQGLGDAIQFLRYIPLVRERSGARRIFLECPPPLRRLLAQNGGFEAELIERPSSRALAPPFQWQASFLDLPLLLECWPPVPISAPYLQADSRLVAIWRERLGAFAHPRIGLAWAGNPTHQNDRTRSIPPEKLLPLLAAGNASFFSLQIQPEGGQPQSLLDAGLIDFTASITDFADTAALVAELDLVITVDTAVAHLAGALGRPVWTLLPFVPDWRWGLEREDTPWYPSMRLFRQPALGDWDAVIQRVAAELGTTVERTLRVADGGRQGRTGTAPSAPTFPPPSPAEVGDATERVPPLR